jgi:hypothetical protein
MRNPHAIVLRKIRGVFGACWQGTPDRFAGAPVYAASPTSSSVLGGLGAIAGALLLPLLVMAAIAFVLVALPVQHEHVAKLPMLGGVALAGTTAEMTELVNKVQTAIAEMRAANDEKLKEIEKKGAADPILVARVEKANADVTALTAELNEVRAAVREQETANARVTSSRSEVRDQDVRGAVMAASG